jgi:hypothetical protein
LCARGAELHDGEAGAGAVGDARNLEDAQAQQRVHVARLGRQLAHQSREPFVAQRRHRSVLSCIQAEHRVACVQHEGSHAALACDHSDELDEIIKGAPPVDAQPALHSDRHTPTYGFSHRRTACGHTCRLEHQPCAVAGLHRAARARGASAVEIDLIVATRDADGGGTCEQLGLAPSQLQHYGMLRL